MANGSSTLLYVLNLVTGCISQINKNSSSATRSANDSQKKIFSSSQAAMEYRRKHNKK